MEGIYPSQWFNKRHLYWPCDTICASLQFMPSWRRLQPPASSPPSQHLAFHRQSPVCAPQSGLQNNHLDKFTVHALKSVQWVVVLSRSLLDAPFNLLATIYHSSIAVVWPDSVLWIGARCGCLRVQIHIFNEFRKCGGTISQLNWIRNNRILTIRSTVLWFFFSLLLNLPSNNMKF